MAQDGELLRPENRRRIDDELDDYLEGASRVTVAVALKGAQAIGQHHPPVWDRVRRAVDDRQPSGPFLLTGSVAGKGTGVHTGAGRIVAIRMHPLSLAERWPGVATVSVRELLEGGRPPVAGTSPFGLEDYTEELFKSGFPGLRDLPVRLRRAQLEGYVARIIDKGFPGLGHQPRRPAALRRWMLANAAATATSASWETVRDAATGAVKSRDVMSEIVGGLIGCSGRLKRWHLS